MKFNNINDFMAWVESPEFQTIIRGRAPLIENLNKYYACAELARKLFDKSASFVFVEKPKETQPHATIEITTKFYYLEKAEKAAFQELLTIADGFEVSHFKDHSVMSFTVDNIWQE